MLLGKLVFLLSFEDSWRKTQRERTRRRLLWRRERIMFYPGTSLHPSMWSRGDTGDKEAWRVYFESSYRGNGKEREIEAKKKQEKELKELLLEEKPDIGPCMSAVVNVTNLWCGNNSRWGLGPVQWNYIWLWWAVVKHSHVFSNTFSGTGNVFSIVFNWDWILELFCFNLAISTFFILNSACSNTTY